MTGRPTVTLKLATSLDGRIAMASGESQWITGEAARREGHGLRARHDAIMVGIGTVLADDPALTVRLHDHSGPQPLRVVLDSRLRNPETAQVASGNSLIFTTASKRPIGSAEIVEVVEVVGRPNLHAVLDTLYARGVRSVLIEGGGEVAAGFLRENLIDRLEWFRAPILLGSEGRPCVAALSLAKLADAPKFRRMSAEIVGDDLWERLERI